MAHGRSRLQLSLCRGENPLPSPITLPQCSCDCVNCVALDRWTHAQSRSTMTRASSMAASAPVPTRSVSRRQSQLTIKDSDTASRVSSRGSRGQRSRRTSIYSRPSFNASTDALVNRRRSLTLNRMTGTSRPAGIKRWEGNTRTTTSWDCLRRVSRSVGPADIVNCLAKLI